MNPFKPNYKLARRLFLTQTNGVLSTHSSQLKGFPFGSIVPYMPNDNGEVILFVSEAAQHSINFKLNPKVSLTIVEGYSGNIQNYGRLTYTGIVKRVNYPSTDLIDRYFRYFPSLIPYKLAKGFSFYSIDLTVVRFIGGSNQVAWIEPEDFLVKNPYWGEAETILLKTMNSGSKQDLLNFCNYYKKMIIKNKDLVSLAGVDIEGFDLILGETKIRFTFKETVDTLAEMKDVLSGMANQAIEGLKENDDESTFNNDSKSFPEEKKNPIKLRN